MNRSTLAVAGLVALVAAAVVAALVFSPSPPIDLGKGRPKPPREERGPRPGTPVAPAAKPLPLPPKGVPGSVAGIVVDPQGGPAAGAEVLLFRGERKLPAVAVSEAENTRRRLVSDLFQFRTEEFGTLRPISSGPAPVVEDRPAARVLTDEEGVFEFEDAPPAIVRLVARKDALSSPEVAARRGSKVRLTLGETCSLKGFVRSADDGRPLDGATIRVMVAGTVNSAEAAADGTFRMEGLPPGQASVITNHPDFSGDCRRDVTLAPGKEKEIEIQLAKGLKLTVKVNAAEENSNPAFPLAEATVGLVRMADKVYVVGTTDEQGKVVFEGLPTGDWLVNAKKDGYLPSGEEKVPLSQEKEWEVSLDKAVYTTLKVKDERGVPVPGAEVWTGNPDEEFEQGSSRRAGTTNDAGEFPFPFDWMGQEAIVFVLKPGFGVGIAQPQDPANDQPIIVVLRQGASLRGRVLDAGGKPVAGAKVYIEVTVEDVQSDDLYATLYTDGDGAYNFPHVPVGSVWVQVEAEGYSNADEDFEAGPGISDYTKDYRLEKLE